MFEFCKSDTKALKKCLYESDIHDAEIEVIDYDSYNNELIIVTNNSIFGAKIKFHFIGVTCFLFLKGDWVCGATKKINALLVEDDYSNIQHLKKWDKDLSVNSLYLLFQTFSEDELHILSEKVVIESEAF